MLQHTTLIWNGNEFEFTDNQLASQSQLHFYFARSSHHMSYNSIVNSLEFISWVSIWQVRTGLILRKEFNKNDYGLYYKVGYL